MNAEEIVRIGMRAGFDEVTVSSLTMRRDYLKIANSKIDSVVRKVDVFANLFVSSKKRVFFTNIERLEKGHVVGVLARAKRSIRVVKPKEDYYGIAEGPFKYKRSGTPDRRIRDMSIDGVADVAYAAINGAIAGKASNVAGTVYAGYTENELATSKSVHAKGAQTELRLSLRAFRGKDFSFHDVTASSKLGSIKAEKMGEDAAEIATSIDKTGRIEKGKYDIVYKQSPAGSLVYLTNTMACIGNVETGGFFTGKLNKQVANREISIFDDGNMKEAIDASPYDSEGFPTQRTAIVEKGKLINYLHNFSTAKKYRTRSTGNAGLVLPDPNVMLFKHRKTVASIDELIRKVDRGVLITNTWYTRFSNYLTGDFSTVPRDLALYIEKGEPRFAIRQGSVGSMVGIRISENMIRMLRNTEYAANDTKQASSWDVEGVYFFMPSILVRDARVSVA